MNENDQEQWLSDGDCVRCRRRDYCSKACKRSRERIKAGMIRIVQDKITQALATKLATKRTEEEK